jgi:hypothetical protein
MEKQSRVVVHGCDGDLQSAKNNKVETLSIEKSHHKSGASFCVRRLQTAAQKLKFEPLHINAIVFSKQKSCQATICINEAVLISSVSPTLRFT